MNFSLRFIEILLLVFACFFTKAQVVHSSHHDDLGSKRTGKLSTSTSSGNGGEGQPWCELYPNSPDENLLCLGSSVTLDISYDGGNSSYLSSSWYCTNPAVNVDPADITDDGLTSTLTVRTPGTYYFTWGDGEAQCMYGWVVKSTLPVNIPDSTIFCPGGSVTLTAPAGNYSSYQWYNNKTLLNGKKQKKITATETGGYYVQVTNSDQCVLNSERVNVNVYHAPASITIKGDTCVKGTLNLDTYNGKLCPQSISWYKGSTLVKTFNKNTGTVVAGGHGKGSGLNQLNQPYGIFLDSAKNAYVADFYNYRIVKWAPGASTGEVITQNLNLLAGYPTDVLWDKLSLYVSTTDGVIKFYPPFNINKIDYGNNWGLCIDSDRSIYYSEDKPEGLDGYYGSVFKTDISGNSSRVAGSYNSEDLATVNYPNGVYVDALQNVYVADNLIDSVNNYYGRIVKWAPGAGTGELIAGGKSYGNAPNQIWFAAGITFDKKGNMYVSDAVNNRVQLFKPGDPHGITIISGFRPWGIKVDDDLNVYVADQTHNRVLKFPSLLYNQFTANSTGTYKAVITYPGGTTVTSNSIRVKNCNNLNKDLSNVNKTNFQWSCTINPNPVQNILRVHLTNVHSTTTVSVIDAAGKKLYTQRVNASGNDELNFNTSNLRAGLYFAQVISNNQSRYLKFIKQ